MGSVGSDQGQQVIHPDPERLWDRRWRSHVVVLAIIATTVAAGMVWPERQYTAALWPLTTLALAHYGPALVEAAATRTDGPLVARFREGVRPFYESLGFAIETGRAGTADRTDERVTDRLRGVLK